MKITIGFLLVLFGLFLDVYTLILALRWNRKGQGPSGVPVFAIFFYAGGVALLPNPIFFMHKGCLFLLLLGVHVAAQYVIPILHRKHNRGQ